MKTLRNLVLVGASCGVLAAPTQMMAQQAHPFGLLFGAVGGQGSGLGMHLSGSYSVALPMQGFAVRLEASFSRWNHSGPPSTSDGSQRTSMMGLGIERSMGKARLHPYVIAGGGLYLQPGAHAAVGANAGAGVRYDFRSFSLSSEMRLHMLGPSHRRLVPLSFGFRF